MSVRQGVGKKITVMDHCELNETLSLKDCATHWHNFNSQQATFTGKAGLSPLGCLINVSTATTFTNLAFSLSQDISATIFFNVSLSRCSLTSCRFNCAATSDASYVLFTLYQCSFNLTAVTISGFSLTCPLLTATANDSSLSFTGNTLVFDGLTLTNIACRSHPLFPISVPSSSLTTASSFKLSNTAAACTSPQDTSFLRATGVARVSFANVSAQGFQNSLSPADPSPEVADGAGMFVELGPSGTVELASTSFRSCSSASGNGRAVALRLGSDPQVSISGKADGASKSFSSCTARNGKGGGVYLLFNQAFASFVMSDLTFDSCAASEGNNVYINPPDFALVATKERCSSTVKTSPSLATMISLTHLQARAPHQCLLKTGQLSSH